MKNTPADDRALEAVADLVQLVQPGSMVQRFILVVETIDGDDRWMSSFQAPGQKRWDTLGLLAYATAIETNVHVVDDLDDDPE